MNYNYAIEQRDFKRIYRLNQMTDRRTFWEDIRKITKRITTEHALGRWQVLAEARYKELKEQKVWNRY